MAEIRIYYECLEQAYHFIQPIIESARCAETIKLVKRAKSANNFPAGVLRAIHQLVIPDILITAIVADKEIPLVIIEFSEAAKAEDHELQKSYGAIAAYLARAFYLKVSGIKVSDKEYGAAEYNPYTTPRILRDALKYDGYIFAQWPTNPDNPTELLRSPNSPACPPEIPILRDTIRSAVIGACKNSERWYENALNILFQAGSYAQYDRQVSAATSLKTLLGEWRARESRNKDPNKLRYFVRDGWVGAKINRFSHAMDPDRGILTFLSLLFSDTYEIFGIYALVRPKEEGLLKAKLETPTSLRRKLRAALDKDHGGLPAWLEAELEKYARRAKRLNTRINFQRVWETHRDEINKNRVVATLAYFLDGLYLNYNGIKLYWNRYALLGEAKGNFGKLVRKQFGFDIDSTPTPISEIIDGVDEDEVTYAIAHRVLIPNGFRILSISYPGAQGSCAVLPEPGKGLSQARNYPDVVAIPPDRSSFDALIGENKGMFRTTGVNSAVREVKKYRTDDESKRALRAAFVRAKVIDQNGVIKDIVIGVGFGATGQQTVWQPDAIDFIFRVVGRTQWSIGIFRQELRDMIPIIEAETRYPQCFQIVPPSNQPTLFE
jgi:hypothetical protein